MNWGPACCMILGRLKHGIINCIISLNAIRWQAIANIYQMHTENELTRQGHALCVFCYGMQPLQFHRFLERLLVWG